MLARGHGGPHLGTVFPAPSFSSTSVFETGALNRISLGQRQALEIHLHCAEVTGAHHGTHVCTWVLGLGFKSSCLRGQHYPLSHLPDPHSSSQKTLIQSTSFLDVSSLRVPEVTRTREGSGLRLWSPASEEQMGVPDPRVPKAGAGGGERKHWSPPSSQPTSFPGHFLFQALLTKQIPQATPFGNPRDSLPTSVWGS